MNRLTDIITETETASAAVKYSEIPAAERWSIINGVAPLDENDHPHTLNGLGHLGVLTDDSFVVAVTGARRATPYGQSVAYEIGKTLAHEGITVMTGGALGCEEYAMAGVMDEGSKTPIIIFSGAGADVLYPKAAATRFVYAYENGAIVSMEEWGMPPRRWAFVNRRRAMARYADMLVVVEAGIRSGTFTQAEYFAKVGKPVFSIPGNIYSPESKGTNELISKGIAQCATSTLDIINAIEKLCEVKRSA